MERHDLRGPDPTDTRTVTRVLRLALVLSVAFAAVLLSLLALASINNNLFQQHYGLLLWLNIGVAVGLAILALELARRLMHRFRQRLFGTRLMARLAIAFVLMTVIPVMLIYTIAVQFLERSIESWFDVPMERALESGLSLGRATLDSMLLDLSSKSKLAANDLRGLTSVTQSEALDSVRERFGVQEAVILTGSGRVIHSSGGRYASLIPDLPSAAALRQLRLARHYAAIESTESRVGPLDNTSQLLRMRVLVPIASGVEASGDDTRYLQFVQPVPTALAQNAEAVQGGFRDYQELSLSRRGLKRIFRITLTVTVLLTVFSAIAAAFLLAGWMTGPLSMLEAGTRAVAEGDFRPLKDYVGRDELGALTQSFNAMIQQLEEARSQVSRTRIGLEQANARLASVLANLSAGVIVFDRQFKVTMINHGAEQILNLPVDRSLGLSLSALGGLQDFESDIARAFGDAVDTQSGTWQRQIVIGGELESGQVGRNNQGKTLLLRGALLPEAQGDHVLVIDDISEVVSAQRIRAWGEVARRLAHEIKNPLTPIQLAAERMQFKLTPALLGNERDLLERNTRTIVTQVNALKVMVDEFRDYARLPSAKIVPLDLNELIMEMLNLYSDTDPSLRIRTKLSPELPNIMGDAGQIRQIIHNLLKNANEATEKQAIRLIEISTDLIHNGNGHYGGVRFGVRDNGPGFPPDLLSRVFEPYVSQKAKGTGLGLAIVKKIVQEHGGTVEVGNHHDAAMQQETAGKAGNRPLDVAANARSVSGAYIYITFAKIVKKADNFEDA
ncbi:MAG: ATP-binding protein [Lautropia sp.]|nr:ATP-binding protein [Lautropia sp.]